MRRIRNSIDVMSLAGKISCLAVSLALVFTFTLSAASPAFAKGFVPSITSKGAPDVVEAVDADGKDVSDKLILTPYSEKDSLAEKKKDRFEEAFDRVKEKDLAEKVNQGLKDGDVAVPKRWGDGTVTIKPEELSVTDIFYIHEKNDSGSVKLGVQMKITTNIPDNQMVAVLYYGEDGWKIVPCKRDKDGNVVFTVEAFGPYMIVTNTVVEVAGDGNNVPASPQTGYDNEAGAADLIGTGGHDLKGIRTYEGDTSKDDGNGAETGLLGKLIRMIVAIF